METTGIIGFLWGSYRNYRVYIGFRVSKFRGLGVEGTK